MYGKIFQTIFTGSLYGRFEATVTHIACIVLSDREGYLNYTPSALAGATGFPLEVIQKGLAELMADDVKSRSKDHDGRRVIEIEPGTMNGFFVVNKAQYRDMQDPDSIREQTRERVRKHRAKRTVTVGNASLRHTDTDEDTDKKKSKSRASALPPDFDLTDSRREYAFSKGIANPEEEMEAFKAHHTAHGKTMKNWDAAWRTWCINAKRFGARHGTEKPRRLSAVDRVRIATAAHVAKDGQEADRGTLAPDDGDVRPQVGKPVR